MVYFVKFYQPILETYLQIPDASISSVMIPEFILQLCVFNFANLPQNPLYFIFPISLASRFHPRDHFCHSAFLHKALQSISRQTNFFVVFLGALNQDFGEKKKNVESFIAQTQTRAYFNTKHHVNVQGIGIRRQMRSVV